MTTFKAPFIFCQADKQSLGKRECVWITCPRHVGNVAMCTLCGISGSNTYIYIYIHIIKKRFGPNVNGVCTIMVNDNGVISVYLFSTWTKWAPFRRWYFQIYFRACRRCSNYIFVLDLTSGSKRFGKDSRKTVWESFKCWDLVRLISKTWRYPCNSPQILVYH